MPYCFSPGSLFTSTIPALLGAGVREALAGFAGPVVYVANVMTQPGETTGFTLADHLRILMEHVGSVVTDVLVHSGDLLRELVARYAAEESTPVEVDREEVERIGVRLREADLLSDEVDADLRYDANHLAKEVCKDRPRSPVKARTSMPEVKASSDQVSRQGVCLCQTRAGQRQRSRQGVSSPITAENRKEFRPDSP